LNDALENRHRLILDNASFIASLAPDLHREIILTADETLLLNSLPPNIIALILKFFVNEHLHSTKENRELQMEASRRGESQDLDQWRNQESRRRKERTIWEKKCDSEWHATNHVMSLLPAPPRETQTPSQSTRGDHYH
jgi:hypothetical protein